MQKAQEAINIVAKQHSVRVAEIFADAEILHTLRTELSWSHLRLLIQIDDPLKRDFYLERRQACIGK